MIRNGLEALCRTVSTEAGIREKGKKDLRNILIEIEGFFALLYIDIIIFSPPNLRVMASTLFMYVLKI